MKKSVLQDMTKCSGCGLCEVLCPVKAIKMQYNKYGFMVPVIDEQKCVQCNICTKKCTAENLQLNEPIGCYAGINLDLNILKKSSSGGMFAATATFVLEHGGVVFGAAIIPKGRIVTVEHIMVDNKKDLYRLQGSKYVHSNAAKSYAEVKNQLEKGKMVLFSGTPCQVAGVQKYLGRQFDNLFTIDLICHGTPSSLYWESSLKKRVSKDAYIENISFRDGEEYMVGHIDYRLDKKRYTETYGIKNDLYYMLFLSADIYQDGCYKCPYANKKRCGDLTIGDFWGFEEEYDQKNIKFPENVDLSNGNSVVLVNTIKGHKMFDSLENTKMWFYPTDYKKAALHNSQLNAPAHKGKNRKFILMLFKIGGWNLVAFVGTIKLKLKNLLKGKTYGESE